MVSRAFVVFGAGEGGGEMVPSRARMRDLLKSSIV